MNEHILKLVARLVGWLEPPQSDAPCGLGADGRAAACPLHAGRHAAWQPHLVRYLIVDSCSVHAKHGGELTGSKPTDRGKKGTK